MRRIPRVKRPSALSTSTSSPLSSSSSRASIALPSIRATPFSSSCSQQRILRCPVTRASLPPSSRRSSLSTIQAYSTEPKHDKIEVNPASTQQGVELEQQAKEAEQQVELPEENWQGIEEYAGEDQDRNFAYVPPPRRSHAERVEDVLDPTYVPATISEGLETLGGLRDWWERPEHWSPARDFKSFRPSVKVTDPLVIEAAVRRAVVETFALRQAGLEDELVGSSWPLGGAEELDRVMGIDIQATGDGGVALDGNITAVLDALIWKDEPSQNAVEHEVTHTEPVETASLAVPSPETAATLKTVWDRSWKTTSLTDQRIKFSICKRIFQLTGHLVPDYKLTDVTTVQTLLHILQKPPKPKTLTEEIQKKHQETLLQLPNVAVATKRVTRGDKEQAFGRLKLMQEEMRKRGLPVEGHGFARKNRELRWLRGGT